MLKIYGENMMNNAFKTFKDKYMTVFTKCYP